MRKYLLLVFCLSLSGLFAQDFYGENHIPAIKLYFERENWASILTRMKDAGQEQRMSAKMEIDGQVFESVGVRFKGNSSFKNVRKGGSPKLPFNIKIDYKEKDQAIGETYETIKLSNLFRDPSFLREFLSYEIARKYLPASQCNFAKLYINDNYIGLYSNTESVDKPLLKRYFDEKNGPLFKCDPEWDTPEAVNCPEGDKASLMYVGPEPRCYYPNYELKSDSGWASLVNLAKLLDASDAELSKVLDIDQTLWMHAFNNVLVNLDSYTGRLSHNYYLYQDKKGCFHPIVWDFNLSFGGFQYDGNGRPLDTEGLQTLSPFVHFKNRNKKRPLIVNLLSDGLYRKIYIAHMRTILEDNFTQGKFEERARQVQQFIAGEVALDKNKLYSDDAFKRNLEETVDADGTPIIGLTELMNKRVEYLSNHPLFLATPPKVEKVEDFKFGETLAVQAKLDDASAGFLFYRYEPFGPFQRLEMKDDGGSNDQSVKDGIWGATIDFKEGTQYYVVAENEKAASLFPERASKEFLTVKSSN